ncbi:hypothetical protein AVEN_176159-1 [Araneus ventricosus]|uniref:Zinc finger BED domain-containing protein 4 n=1 Tax=Araneus ventricosus TaxID=182803 RepID=A0A4Y2Q6M4_ARAVE|nr:hypothetical protein AVEN_176159-1 [Araneus ventricosus]
MLKINKGSYKGLKIHLRTKHCIDLSSENNQSNCPNSDLFPKVSKSKTDSVDITCEEEIPKKKSKTIDSYFEKENSMEKMSSRMVCKDDTDDDDTNDTHEEGGVTVTTTTDPRHLHLSRAEVIPRYNYLLQKVRKMVKLFRRPPTKLDMYLQKYVKEDTGKGLSLILDCRTRWNSLLVMTERFHKLKVYMDKVLIDIGSDTKFSDLEWSKIKQLIDSLQPFKLAVEALCRRDSTLLTAETTLKFILEKLLSQDTVLKC